MRALLVGMILPLGAACDGGGGGQDDLCERFEAPEREERSSCEDVRAEAPGELVSCERGSGHPGVWVVDPDGLPAYEVTLDPRCDPVGRHWSPRSRPAEDPVHVIGNGRGLVAMAHATGEVELYTQDRGHAWLNRRDTWRDPETPAFPPQVAGGFNYVEVGGKVLSNRFADLPPSEASARQVRRFGVGYFETETTFDRAIIRRRVFAPNAEARALVAEVTLENPTGKERLYQLVELWDLNLHQIPVELATSDLLNPSLTETIDRRRRRLAAEFRHRAVYAPEKGSIVVETEAVSPPVARGEISEVDYFPPPVYLGVVDPLVEPEGAYLVDEDLWGDAPDRAPPRSIPKGRTSGAALEIAGEGQHGLVAVRVPVRVPAGEAVTRRFAFGYAPRGHDPEEDLAALRQRGASLGQETVEAWRDRLVWAAFPGLEAAGAIQREIAWSAYSSLALVTYDEYRDVRVLGQGGSYKYIHGLDGAIGDLCLYAEAMLLIDPEVARETLEYALTTQHGSTTDTPWRYPYATTGFGAFSDVGLYSQRSDAYFLVPWMVAEYVAATRDAGFLEAELPYWPRSAGESETVARHLRRTFDYAAGELGLGARGLVAIGTGDYADGILSLTEHETTPTGTSSTFNAGFVVRGFPLAADVLEPVDPDLAAEMRALAESQAEALEAEAWSGSFYHRGFVDSGQPLAPEILFLEPQLFPILAGLTDPERTGRILDLISRELETPIGAVSNVAIESEEAGGVDEPQIGGIWPVANAWLTEAYARRDPAEGWQSFIKNTLSAHAEAYPGIWYGIWTGPDSFNGPDHERAGEADAHLATALTDYPALNAHVHTSPLRALARIVGVSGTAQGLRIAPRVPTETFAVVWPRLEVRSTPSSIRGAVTAEAGGAMTMEVSLPSGLRGGGELEITVDGASLEDYVQVDGAVAFEIPARAGEPVSWAVLSR